MDWLMIALLAIPTLFVVGASATATEDTAIFLWSGQACCAAIGITCLWLRSARRKREQLWPGLIGGIACLAVIVSVASFQWPLRVTYLLSRSSLDRLADDMHAGKAFAGPARVGLFTVIDAELSRSGVAYLWVDTNPSGRTGFVHDAPSQVPLNLWSSVRLDDRWQFIHED